MTDEEKKAIERLTKAQNDIWYATLYSQEQQDEDIQTLLNLIEKKDKEINILERRLRHLFKSETIRKYDAIDSRTQNYKLDINELDSKCENCNYARRLNIAENKLYELEKSFKDQKTREYEKAINTIAKYYPCSLEDIKDIIETQINYKLLLELQQQKQVNILELHTKLEEKDKTINKMADEFIQNGIFVNSKVEDVIEYYEKKKRYRKWDTDIIYIKLKKKN